MKKIYFLIALFFVFFLFFQQAVVQKKVQELLQYKVEKSNVPTEPIEVGSQTLFVEVARTSDQITRGLGQRDSIGSDGMLFVLPGKSIPSFWMKDMRFDLDFIWLNENTVVDLTENVSAQRGEPENRLKVYSPSVPVTHVLEMKAGDIKRRGIRIGDIWKFTR